MASGGRHVHGPRRAGGPRWAGGPRPVGALVPVLTRPAFRRRAPATAQVIADWEVIVGPALAATTAPRRLQAGSLTIACAGPVAMELQHLSVELLARINRHVGGQPVTRLRFVQDPAPVAIARSIEAASPQAAAAAERATETVPPGPLRDALAALGRAVLTRSPVPPPRPRN